MTALLTADEAARLRVGERLVIVRPGDPHITPDAVGAAFAAVLNKGKGAGVPHLFVAPQDWVALTGPWTGQIVLAGDKRFAVDGGIENGLRELTEDGRRIEPLYTECTNREWIGGTEKVCPTCGGGGRKLVGRGSIEVVPVYEMDDDPRSGNRIVLWRRNRLYLLRGESEGYMSVANPDNLPVPGRDFGIVIDCVEVAE